jgi:hypothetical protein
MGQSTREQQTTTTKYQKRGRMGGVSIWFKQKQTKQKIKYS